MIVAVLFAVFGTMASPKLIGMQTSDPEIIREGVRYLNICFIFSVGLCGQICMERLLQSTGLSLYSMFTQIFGAVLNIILDPFFIFGWAFFPKLGVSGAAVATVMSQIIAFLFGLYLNFKRNKEINLLQDHFHVNGAMIKGILAVGIPSAIMISVNSLSNFMINAILAAFGSAAVVALGIYFKVQSFVFMPVFGMNNGLIPIIAYNYGAGHRERIYDVMKLAYKVALVVMSVGFIIFQLFPAQLMGFFDPSPELLSIGVVALRIISFSFIFAAVSIISSGIFQSLGNGLLSMIVNLVRQLIFIVPLAYLFSRTGVLAYVWLAYPIAELMAMLIAIIFMKKVNEKEIKLIVERD